MYTDFRVVGSRAVPCRGLCVRSACPITLKTIETPQGGRIVYGLVDGATSPAGAMATMLRTVHNTCGENEEVSEEETREYGIDEQGRLSERSTKECETGRGSFSLQVRHARQLGGEGHRRPWRRGPRIHRVKH